jgi:hypothetical protein
MPLTVRVAAGRWRANSCQARVSARGKSCARAHASRMSRRRFLRARGMTSVTEGGAEGYAPLRIVARESLSACRSKHRVVIRSVTRSARPHGFCRVVLTDLLSAAVSTGSRNPYLETPSSRTRLACSVDAGARDVVRRDACLEGSSSHCSPSSLELMSVCSQRVVLDVAGCANRIALARLPSTLRPTCDAYLRNGGSRMLQTEASIAAASTALL